MADFAPDRAWRLHHQVAIRPEPFGAMLYHFGTRKLSFLKSHTVVALVNALADHPSARAAYEAVGVPAHETRMYDAALAQLAATHMLVPREDQG